MRIATLRTANLSSCANPKINDRLDYVWILINSGRNVEVDTLHRIMLLIEGPKLQIFGGGAGGNQSITEFNAVQFRIRFHRKDLCNRIQDSRMRDSCAVRGIPQSLTPSLSARKRFPARRRCRKRDTECNGSAVGSAAARHSKPRRRTSAQ